MPRARCMVLLHVVLWLHPLPCVRAALSPLEVTPTSDAQNQQDKARPLIVSDGATIVPRIGTIHTAKPRAIAAGPAFAAVRTTNSVALTVVELVDSLESLGSVDRFSDSATAACGAGRGPARTLEGVHALLHIVCRGGASRHVRRSHCSAAVTRLG